MIHVLGMLGRLTLVKNNIVGTAEMLTNPQYHYWVLGYVRITQDGPPQGVCNHTWPLPRKVEIEGRRIKGS